VNVESRRIWRKRHPYSTTQLSQYRREQKRNLKKGKKGAILGSFIRYFVENSYSAWLSLLH